MQKSTPVNHHGGQAVNVELRNKPQTVMSMEHHAFSRQWTISPDFAPGFNTLQQEEEDEEGHDLFRNNINYILGTNLKA